VLGRLKEKQELLAKADKKEAPTPEKKPERDMQ
jgi:ppGpp synthetase/RelA/SpoT-type nucleotidyltranferase